MSVPNPTGFFHRIVIRLSDGESQSAKEVAVQLEEDSYIPDLTWTELDDGSVRVEYPRPLKSKVNYILQGSGVKRKKVKGA